MEVIVAEDRLGSRLCKDLLLQGMTRSECPTNPSLVPASSIPMTQRGRKGISFLPKASLVDSSRPPGVKDESGPGQIPSSAVGGSYLQPGTHTCCRFQKEGARRRPADWGSSAPAPQGLQGNFGNGINISSYQEARRRRHPEVPWEMKMCCFMQSCYSFSKYFFELVRQKE